MKKITALLSLFLLLACTRPVMEPAAGHPSADEKDEKDEKKEDATLEMTAEAQGHIGLQVVTAKVQSLMEYLSVTGTVQPVDNRIAHVRPLAAGRLTGVQVKVGDRVAADETLATFDNTEAGDIVAQYQSARAELEKLSVQLSIARQQTERSRQLAEIGAISRKEYELASAEEKTVAASIQAQNSVINGLLVKLKRFGLDEDRLGSSTATALRAPFAGVVIAANAAPGEVIAPESELFQIADLSQVWVQAEVYEKDLGRLQLGEAASITVDTYPDREFLGRVSHVSDLLDKETRTAKVRCDVMNAEGRLKLDMFATVQLPTTFRKEALAISSEAVQQIEGRNVVFVRTGATTFRQKAVMIGRSTRGVTEILSGLGAGESVVTKGAFHLKSMVLGAEIGEEH